jgi:heat shock protein HtpX
MAGPFVFLQEAYSIAMATLYTHQDENIAKTWILMAGFLCVVILIGWAISYWFQSPIILLIAVIFAFAVNIWSYWNSDKVVIRMSKAQPADKAQYPELYRVVENLAITAGLPMPKIYIINDPAPNAFATGRNKEHSAIAVTSGLLQMMDENELQGVIAHELSHVGNRDILVSTVAVILVGFVTLAAEFFLRFELLGGGGGGRDRDRSNPVLMVLAIVFIVLAPIVATLLQLAISRKREYLADASGALLTRYPEGLASALRKIGQYEAPMRGASNATAHLYISNPFGPHAAKSFLTRLFSTHPPIEDRIKALLDN